MTKGLTGLRVLDLSAALTGPYCSMILADQGADVIKIEPPEGEIFRNLGPYYRGEWSAYFVGLHRNKRSAVLDLKTEGGLRTFHDLVKKSDVVLNNFRPGVTQKLRIDYNTLSSLNPKIITCSITGFGSEGSMKHRTAFDLAIQAASGVLSVTGTEEGELVKNGVPVADLGAGMFAAIGILTALHERSISGVGQHVDISMFDTQISMLSYLVSWYTASGDIPRPLGTGHLGFAPYGSYKTKDGHLVWAISTDKFWPKLCQALGVPELIDDPRFDVIAKRQANRDELRKILEDILSQRTTAEWMALMEEAGIPSAPVNRINEALEEPCVKERNMLVDLDQPRYGERARVVGNAIKLSRTPGEDFTPCPALGEHTVEVLSQLLEYPNDIIQQLLDSGCAMQSPHCDER